jgi:DNA polymerase-3 subunit gamma/tau
MTFYLKYRPQTLDELDIVSVRTQLKKIIESNAIPHAFLFIGTRGTGKTSAARILAKIINCNFKNRPCNKCDSCISITNGTNPDVVEMDAASNRGIEDIRNLKDVVKLAPVLSRYKIYIIDEAHMLTLDASNALLKTLEEPPSHVYFILATTNPEKIIDTIKSRAVIVDFTKATVEEIVFALKRIIEKEKIKISEKNLTRIASLSGGSFRDAVKILEQFSKDSSVLDQMQVDFVDFIKLIENKKTAEILNFIEEAHKKGLEPKQMVEKILNLLRTELLAHSNIGDKKYKFEKRKLIQLIELLVHSIEDIKYSPIETLPLEVAILKWCNE